MCDLDCGEYDETVVEAIANADAHLNNVGLPTYSEAMIIIVSVSATLEVLIDMGRIPHTSTGIPELLHLATRHRAAKK